RISPGRRVRLHRRIGGCLESGYGTGSDVSPAEPALHFVRGRDPGRAVRYLQDAARHALLRSAHREAVDHLTAALERLPALPDGPERARQEVGIRLALGSALIALRGWADPEVERAFADAHHLSQRLADRSYSSRALLGLAVVHES